MILANVIAQGVAAGKVTKVYRRWAEPRVVAGSTMHTSAGVVAIEGIEEVDPARITDRDAQAAGASSAADVIGALRGSEGQPVFCIGVRWVGPDPRDALSRDDELSPQATEEIAAALARMDRRSSGGAWTQAVLETVAANPERRAAELAKLLGRDKEEFKLDVRKLKNLGLTHSLQTGYRISPRGAAYLATRAAAGD